MSLYPKPAVMQDFPIEKENPAIKTASTPQPQRTQASGLTKTYGRLSQQPPKTPSSRAPMTPGAAQRRKIFQHQLLMKQYEEEKAKKQQARAVSALATPARVPTSRPASVSVRRPADSKVSALSKKLGSLSLERKAPSDEDEGFQTPDDEFYDVPEDFDFKHDTPAKAYRRSMREQQAEMQESSQNLEQDLRRAQTLLDVGDVSGAQRICNQLYETQQQQVFKSARYYAVASTVSRRSKNVVKAISLLSSAVRVGAEPTDVLRAAIRRFLEAPEGKAVRSDLETLLQRLSSSTSSTAKTPSKTPVVPVKAVTASASKIAAFRSRTQASFDALSNTKPQDEQDVKVLTTLMASAIEKEKVLQRLAHNKAAPAHSTAAASSSLTSSSAVDEIVAVQRKQAPRTCEIIRTHAQRAKHGQRLASSPFFRANRPAWLADGSRPASSRPSSRALDFTPTVLPLSSEERAAVVAAIPSAEPVDEASTRRSVVGDDDEEFVVRYEAPDFDESEDAPCGRDLQQHSEPLAAPVEAEKPADNEDVQSQEAAEEELEPAAVAPASKQSSSKTQDQTELLQDWLGKTEPSEAELGRYKTFALTQSRGRQGRKKVVAEREVAAHSLLVPVEIGGEVALMSYDHSAINPSDQILTPVRRSARLNPQAAAHQLKPKVLKFRENPL